MVISTGMTKLKAIGWDILSTN